MNRIKTVTAGICCAMAITSLAACGSSSGGKKTVEFMTMQSTGTPQLKALQGIGKKFEEKNPDIVIKMVPGTNNNENDIKVRLAGHNPLTSGTPTAGPATGTATFWSPCRTGPGPRD